MKPLDSLWAKVTCAALVASLLARRRSSFVFLVSSCSCGCCNRGGGRRYGLAQPRAACPWLVWGPVRRPQRAPRKFSGGSTRLQQAPETQIGSRMFQEAPGGTSRPQELQLAPGGFQEVPGFPRGFNWFQEAPADPSRPQEAPGGPRRPQEAPASGPRPSQPGFPQHAPQRSTHGQLTVNTTVNTRSTQRSTSLKINELLRACWKIAAGGFNS